MKGHHDDIYSSGRDFETAKVQITSYLKGESSWALNATIDASPNASDIIYPWEAAEHFEAEKTAILMPDESSDKTHLSIPHCGVLIDSPEVRSELQRGFQQNDVIRHKEKSGKILW